MKPNYHFDETFTENFWFFIGWKPEDVEWYMKRHYVFETMSLNGDGKTVEFQKDTGERTIAIWTRSKYEDHKLYSVLAHECVHATHFCLRHRGVIADFNNDELTAYMVGALVRKALSFGPKKRTRKKT